MPNAWSDTLAARRAGEVPWHQGASESDEAFAARMAAHLAQEQPAAPTDATPGTPPAPPPGFAERVKHELGIA